MCDHLKFAEWTHNEIIFVLWCKQILFFEKEKENSKIMKNYQNGKKTTKLHDEYT